MTKEEMLQTLYQEYYLQFERQDIVLGCGDINARIMFVGEAPGDEEIRLNMPFVGITRKRVNQILKVLEIKREDVFMTHTIKHRLSKKSPTTGKLINRAPKATEIMRTKPYLLREIVCVEPKYIVTLGNMPLKVVVGGKGCKVADLHGKMQEIMLSNRTYRVFPLYNPSSVVYNQGLKETYENDIYLLKEEVKEALKKE